jgi:hypothetical protein
MGSRLKERKYFFKDEVTAPHTTMITKSLIAFSRYSTWIL